MMIFKACEEITVLEGAGHYLLRATSAPGVSLWPHHRLDHFGT